MWRRGTLEDRTKARIQQTNPLAENSISFNLKSSDRRLGEKRDNPQGKTVFGEHRKLKDCKRSIKEL
jgi:hypothetical protein